MTTFRATAEDLEGLIGERQRAVMRRSWQYPGGAAAAAVALAFVDARLATFALGAAAAWIYGVIVEYRSIRPAFLWNCAWLLEEITVDVDEVGLHLTGARGNSLMRWDGGISIHRRSEHFVVKDEIDELAVLPKKYLSEAELVLLNAHATDA